MRIGPIFIVAFLVAVIAVVVSPLLAKAPADLAKLVGAGANGAESAMEVLGYKPTGKSDGIFFNSETGICVQVHVSIDETGGKESSIDTIDRAECDR